MFGLFKKQITTKELAAGLYVGFIRDVVKEPIKDVDGNVILSEDEQALLLLTHVCTLLDAYSMKQVIPRVQSIFVQENRDVREDGDWEVHMLSVIDSVKKIQKYLGNLPSESNEFYKKDFVFDKKLDPTQKTLALSWHTELTKALDLVFKDSLRKFKLKDDGGGK